MKKRKRMKRKGALTRNVGYRRRWLATRLYINLVHYNRVLTRKILISEEKCPGDFKLL